MDYTELLKKWAGEKGDTAYLVLKDRKITYRQAYEDVCRFMQSAWLQRFPEQGKTSVLIVTPHLYHQLLAFLAVMGAGQIPIIGHCDLPTEAEGELVEHNRIGFVLTEDGQGWKLRRGYAGKQKTASTSGSRQQDKGTQRSGENKSTADAACLYDFRPVPVPYQEACMGVLSSGSTGVPKVMYRTYESWADFLPEQNRRFCIDSDAMVFVEGSFSFTGNLSVWASVIYAGCTLVLSDVFNCRQWLGLIAAFQVTVLYLVPAKLKVLTRYLINRKYPTMRAVLAGSQLLGEKTAKKLKASFPNSEIILYYGASELNYITWLSYEEVLRFPDSVGKPVPGVKVWVENGLIFIDTPYHVSGLRRPCTLRDTGYLNEDGYLIFSGRENDIINRGGFKISCTKVENALCALPEVLQAVVLPYADPERGEEAAAFVVCDVAMDRQELRQSLRKTLMQQEMPKKILFLQEILLNSRGKPDKQALLAMLE